MLLPNKRDPATGSLIPSISTGGAAMNATIKQAAAVRRHGIIKTPNQPTYKRLLVEVTHSQNSSHPDSRPPRLREIVVLWNKCGIWRVKKRRNLFSHRSRLTGAWLSEEILTVILYMKKCYLVKGVSTLHFLMIVIRYSYWVLLLICHVHHGQK